MGQILPVQIVQLFRHVHISVQVDVAVGGMIKFPVKLQKFFISQLRDHIRVAARFHGVWRIRIQGLGNFSFQHVVRGGKRALHLIVNHAVYGKLRLRAFQLVMPALLLEDLLFLINIRIKNRVQIDVHQVLEIRIVAARDRIHGLIRIGHGV